MGTINYKTSDYITMGIKPYVDADWPFDREDWDLECEQAVEEIRADIGFCDFAYYHVTVEWGYYEGFCILIENNYGLYYDDYTDKRYAQKEITRLKKFLKECALMGLVSCYPGWCTGYADYAGTLKDIDEAIKEMREEVKRIPTWSQLERAGE